MKEVKVFIFLFLLFDFSTYHVEFGEPNLGLIFHDFLLYIYLSFFSVVCSIASCFLRLLIILYSFLCSYASIYVVFRSFSPVFPILSFLTFFYCSYLFNLMRTSPFSHILSSVHFKSSNTNSSQNHRRNIFIDQLQVMVFFSYRYPWLAYWADHNFCFYFSV